MRKRTKTLLIIVGILVLSGVVLFVLKPRGGAPDAEAQIDTYIEAALAVPQKSDTAGASIESEILKHMSYTITAKAESAATLSVTAPDVGVLVDEMTALGGSLEAQQAFLLAALQNGEFDSVTTVVNVELDENGAPVDSFAFADAMYGGLLTKYEELLKGAVSGK